MSLFPIAIDNSGDDAVNHMVEVRLAQEAVAVGKDIVYVKLAHDMSHKI